MPDRNEVILIAEATALPGKEQELREAIYILVPQALAEEGISIFRLHEDREVPGHFMLYERFKNQEAIESHFATEHFKVISDAAARLAQGGKPKITYYHVLTE
jgi:quinol monooxygenase YgiN